MSAERWLRQISSQGVELWNGTEKRIELQSGDAESGSWRQPVGLRGCTVPCQEWTWILQEGIAIPPGNCEIHLSLHSCTVLTKHPYWGSLFYHLPCYFLYSLLHSQGDAGRISQKCSQRKYFSAQSWKGEEGFWTGVGKERTVMLAQSYCKIPEVKYFHFTEDFLKELI